MKSKVLKVLIPLLIIIAFFGFFFYHNSKTESPKENKTVVKKDKKAESIDIKSLKEKYHNNDIVAYIEIPGVTKSIVLQSDDNDYYLNHNYKKEYDIKGSIVLDYRNKLSDRKILIYGHSGKEKDLPFLKLNNYIKKDYWEEHNAINLYTMEKIRKYKIYSSYIETSDYDYVNLNSFNGLSWEEHINKLKNKSLYETGIELDENDNIIILQTCSMNDEGYQKYHLVIGKEV